jgi:hypothetical protein
MLPTWTTDDVRWSEILEIASVAAEVGFDALYASDHLLLPSNNAEMKRRAGVDFPDDPHVELEGYLECFSVLAALAVAIPKEALAPWSRAPAIATRASWPRWRSPSTTSAAPPVLGLGSETLRAST